MALRAGRPGLIVMRKTCQRNDWLRYNIIGIAISGCAVTMPAIARVDYSYAVEAEHTDNVALASANEESEKIYSGLAALSLAESGAKLSADIRAVADYTDYRNNTFSDDVWYYLSSDINWTIRPSSFVWVMQDYFSQQELDTALPSTPDNVIDTNAFTTGPDFFFHLDAASRLGLSARITDYRFENLTADSRRASLNANWTYGLDSMTELSVNAEHQTADFSEDSSLDFNRQDLYFSVRQQRSRSHFQFDLGTSLIDRDAYEDVDGFLLRLIWRNQFRATSHFQLNAISQYTDTGQDLLGAGSADQQLNPAGEQISGDIFRDQRLYASYQLGFSSYNYQLLGMYREEDYEISQQDRITRSIQFTFDYMRSTRLNISTYIQFHQYENLNFIQTNDESSARFVINYRLTRDYSLRSEYLYRKQQSDIPDNEYAENRFLISFYYGRHPESYR